MLGEDGNSSGGGVLFVLVPHEYPPEQSVGLATELDDVATFDEPDAGIHTEEPQAQ